MTFLPRRAWFRIAGADVRHPGPLGLLYDGEWHDLSSVLGDGAFDSIARLSDGTLRGPGLDQLRARCSQATRLATRPRFGLPVPRPEKILCLGKNYAAHAAEFGSIAPSEPMFFTKLGECLLPAEQDVALPDGVGRVDHEGELCLVIGSDGSHLSEHAAGATVAGLTLIDDVTARHLQGEDRKKGFPWVRSKSFDTFGPCGPWVIPFEDAFDGPIPDDATPDLALELRVGETAKQHSRTSLMVHKIAPTLAYLSRHTTLRAGDLIATGTPEGVSPLGPGDTVQLTIERVGCLTHGVRCATRSQATE